jgi:hypothetical protein
MANAHRAAIASALILSGDVVAVRFRGDFARVDDDIRHWDGEEEASELDLSGYRDVASL